jgi:hypothetical protein
MTEVLIIPVNSEKASGFLCSGNLEPGLHNHQSCTFKNAGLTLLICTCVENSRDYQMERDIFDSSNYKYCSVSVYL